MNSDILRRMRDALAAVDSSEARALVAEYDAHDWFVTSTIAAVVDDDPHGAVE